MKIDSAICSAIAWILMFPGAVFGETIALTPVADSELREFAPTLNLGSGSTVVSGATGVFNNQEIRRALYRFDLSTIPQGAIINSASLQIRVVRVPIQPGNSNFDLRRVLQSWSESGVTWVDRSPGNPWQTPGAGGSSDASPVASSTTFVAGLGTYFFSSTPELAADVQAWVNNPDANFGWLFLSQQEETLRTARHFTARESGPEAPVLTIDYSIPAAPLITAQPSDQTVAEGSTAIFTVEASGAAPLMYQWFFGTNQIPGASGSSLVLTNVSVDDAGTYSVLISNPGGFVQSDPAVLTVQPAVFPPPSIAFITPTNNQLFPDAANVLVSVRAEASDGVITRIDLSMDNIPAATIAGPDLDFVLTNVASGNHQLLARAFDSHGGSNTAIVSIRALTVPSLTIIRPAAGSRVAIGSNVVVEAVAGAGENFVTNVQFIVNDAVVAVADSAPFVAEWTPIDPGTYVLFARGFDRFGRPVSSAQITNRVFVPETVPPRIRLTFAPPNFSRLRSGSIILRGTASDNEAVDRVEAQINDGPFTPVQGAEIWTAGIELPAGFNTVRIRSVDQAGNMSALIARFYTFVLRTPIELRTVGNGIVTPDLNGRALEVGKVYNVRAVPAHGWIFANWTGAPGTATTLSFYMQSNLVLTAAFVPNPFPAVRGAYAGLVFSETNSASAGSGRFTMNVSSRGALSGRLIIDGRSHAFSGRFNAFGLARIAVVRPPLGPIALELNLDLTNATGVVTGTATDGTWRSELLGHRNPFYASNPSPNVGSHLFSVNATKTSDASAEIVGRARIAPDGRVVVVGRAGDGTIFDYSTFVSSEATIPFYVTLTSRDAVSGWLRFTPVPEPGESVLWFDESADGFSEPEIAP